MKKLIFAVLLLAGLTVTAQTNHLTFKGIPINGTLNEFVGKLKQKGFSLLSNEQGVAILEGEFAAYKGCMVAVYQHESGVVNRVGVMFPERDTWSMLYNDYSKLKNMLTQKYGNPSDVIEEFQGYPAPQNDNDKLYEVGMDRCRYMSDFTAENGVVELRIEHNSFLSYYIVLVYVDAENESKVRSSAIDDL